MTCLGHTELYNLYVIVICAGTPRLKGEYFN